MGRKMGEEDLGGRLGGKRWGRQRWVALQYRKINRLPTTKSGHEQHLLECCNTCFSIDADASAKYIDNIQRKTTNDPSINFEIISCSSSKCIYPKCQVALLFFTERCFYNRPEKVIGKDRNLESTGTYILSQEQLKRTLEIIEISKCLRKPVDCFTLYAIKASQ